MKRTQQGVGKIGQLLVPRSGSSHRAGLVLAAAIVAGMAASAYGTLDDIVLIKPADASNEAIWHIDIDLDGQFEATTNWGFARGVSSPDGEEQVGPLQPEAGSRPQGPTTDSVIAVR